eukprot:TRINITY_DN91613_c0_g1_i1.p1 TRINITY_DN91613_c0_g1~~TRINITY_DN91613_c0_g1_i1.p1  ORF type:complete len:701 (-),score=152.74 TRINITY_DN91613_c0_g1_i1:48-2150(-)
MATESLPSPLQAAPQRMPGLCPKWFAQYSSEKSEANQVAEGLWQSNASATTVVYLAKFLAADLEHMVLTGDSLKGDQDVEFVGICRVFSGTMRPGDDVFIVQESSSGESVPRVLRVGKLFLLMGRFLEEVTEGPAGSILACQLIGQGEAAAELGVERSLTLCGVKDGPCFETPYSSQAFAIVRVSIEPQNVTDIDALERGLRLLHRADPSVSVEAMVTGENVLGCCGDEHLKRCVGDLQKLYARDVPLSISKPLVAVRESLAKSVLAERIDSKGSSLWLPSWMSHVLDASTEASSQFSAPASDRDDASDIGLAVGAAQERVSMSSSAVTTVWTANRKACIRISAVALPDNILQWMDDHAEALEMVLHRQQVSVELAGAACEQTLQGCLSEVEHHFDRLRAASGDDCSLELLGDDCQPTLCGMSVTKGSRSILLDASGAAWSLQQSYQVSLAVHEAKDAQSDNSSESVPEWMRPNILTGFQLAASSGPLCEEPIRGVAFIIHGCQELSSDEPGGSSGYSQALANSAAASASPYGPMSGQVMVAAKEACRYCLFRRGFSRICEAMLSLDVHCEQEMLGKVYAVLSKRRAQFQDEGLRPGTSLFYIHSFLPLADSFGLAHDLRSAASGHVSFHCAFSHWELSEEDPFQEASLTAEELEELGDQPLPPNNARKLVDEIRKRKGLPTDEKVVKDGTKQRTVTRMK